jgi:hypothetical protein
MNNSKQARDALRLTVPDFKTRRKLVEQGYIAMTPEEREAIPTRTAIEKALSSQGYGTQLINRIMTFGIR